MTGATTLTEPDQIRLFGIKQLQLAVRLEMKGMRHSSGKSAYAHAKKVFNLKGTKQEVYDQLEKLYNDGVEAYRKSKEQENEDLLEPDRP